jgi:cell division protein FtsQ
MPARAHRSPTGGFVRPGGSRVRPRVLALAASAAVLAVMAAAASAIAVLERQEEAASISKGWIDRAAVAAGLKPARIELRGNRHTSHSDVLAALALHEIPSQLSFDVESAARRIEALPWVATAKVSRLLPDAVAVEITERRPSILWRAPDRDVLLDIDGRELARVPRGSDTGLPVVIGEGAGPAAPALLALLGSHPEIERRLVASERIEDRRWRLHLAAGTRLELPAGAMAAALAWLDAQAATGILDRGLEVVDLRVADQLVVRAGTGQVARSMANSSAPRHTSRASAGGGTP